MMGGPASVVGAASGSPRRWTQPRAAPPPYIALGTGYSDYVQDTTHYHSEHHVRAWKDCHIAVANGGQGDYDA
jgi:hypothetical protein